MIGARPGWRVTGCLLLVLIALASCTDISCGCSPPPSPFAIVWGQVVTDSGFPAAGAQILVSVRPPSAPCAVVPLSPVPTPTDAQGNYSVQLYQALPVDSACVFIGARRSSTLRDTLSGPIRLDFRFAPPDSAKVDLVVPTH